MVLSLVFGCLGIMSALSSSLVKNLAADIQARWRVREIEAETPTDD